MRYLHLLSAALLGPLLACAPPKDELTIEGEKLYVQMEKMAYYAPSLDAFGRRAESIFKTTKKWPANETDLFKQGPMIVKYRTRAGQQVATWTTKNFKLSIGEWKAGRPVYKLNVGGLEREMYMSP